MKQKTLDRFGPLIILLALLGVLATSLLNVTPRVGQFLVVVLFVWPCMFFPGVCSRTKRGADE